MPPSSLLHGLPFINCNSVMSKYSASKYEWKIPSVHIFVGDGFFLSRDSSSSVRMLMPTLDREKNHTQCLFLLARAFFSTLVLRHIYVVQRAQWFSRAWNIKKCWIRFVFCLCIAPVRVYIANFHVQCENVSAEEWESWCEFYRHSTRIWKWRRRTKEKKSTQTETV